MIALALALAVVPSPANPTDPLLDRVASKNHAVSTAAIAEVMTAPERADPFTYALVAGRLWEEGRRRQAAFWFYVFQIRSRPWAEADLDGSGLAALRASLNDQLGAPINGWLGGDLAAWRMLAERAMAYEARLPLYPGRPDGMSAAAWPALVEKARADYRRGYDATLAKADPADFAATRRAAGLPVGPLPDPGPPLPDAWH